MRKKGLKASKDANAILSQAHISASGPDESGTLTSNSPILDTSPSPSMALAPRERNEELEAKWEARLKMMEAWQVATEEKLKFALAENMKLSMNASGSTMAVQSLKAFKDNDIKPESRNISTKSRSLFEDGNGNLVPRERLHIGQAMRRSLLASPHFKGVELRTPHVHVYVGIDTRVSIYDHLHILSVLMHVIQARKMTQRNVNPNDLRDEIISKNGHYLVHKELLNSILQNTACFHYLSRLCGSNKGRIRTTFRDTLESQLQFITQPKKLLLESLLKIVSRQQAFLSQRTCSESFPSFRKYQMDRKHEDSPENYAVQTVIEACSVKLQQYLYTDEDNLGSDYLDLTSVNNEAIAIACLHLSLHLLGSAAVKDDPTCLTEQVIELADKIEPYIKAQRECLTDEQKLYFKCQRKTFFPEWLKKDKVIDQNITPSSQSRKRYRADNNMIYGISKHPSTSTSKNISRESTPTLSTPSTVSHSSRATPVILDENEDDDDPFESLPHNFLPPKAPQQGRVSRHDLYGEINEDDDEENDDVEE